MSQGPRVLRPDRAQRHWDMVDLESQLPPEHPARVVWAFVIGSDLHGFYARIKSRDDQAGRPAADPAVLLALWLYGTRDAVGSARAIERLCGGVPVNHDMLSAFRREEGALLDALLTRSLTALIAEGLLELEEVAIDGTKVRSHAGPSSMAGRDRLLRLQATVAERVARLRGELEQHGAAGAARQRQRALQAAQRQAERLARAHAQLAVLEQEKAERAATHRVAEAAKPAPKVSTCDPQVRAMRMADGATRPAWNVQVAACGGDVVSIEPTDRRNDSGLASGLLEQIGRRCDGTRKRLPTRLLADATAMTIGDIADAGGRDRQGAQRLLAAGDRAQSGACVSTPLRRRLGKPAAYVTSWHAAAPRRCVRRPAPSTAKSPRRGGQSQAIRIG